jgi:hypothetical protein
MALLSAASRLHVLLATIYLVLVPVGCAGLSQARRAGGRGYLRGGEAERSERGGGWREGAEGERRECPRSRASEAGQGPATGLHGRPHYPPRYCQSRKDPEAERATDARSAAYGVRPPSEVPRRKPATAERRFPKCHACQPLARMGALGGAE